MEATSYIRVVVALVFVVGLIGVTAVLWRKYAWEKGLQWASGVRRKRLRQLDSLILDGRRRLVLVQSDDKEFLLLLGQSADLVLHEGKAAEALPLPKQEENKNNSM